MALTDKLTNIADAIREKTNTNNKMTLDNMAIEIEKIATTPVLQDKSIEITENGTQIIVADEGFDGLGNVEINANINLNPEKGIVIKEWNEDGYPTSVIVNNMDIPNYALQSQGFFTKVADVDLVGNVTSIGSNAFYGNTNLSEVNLPETLTSIGEYAFYNCSNLELAKLPDNLTGDLMRVFYNCAKITINKIPNAITSLASQSFYGCKSIKEMDLNNVSRLGGNNFQNCTGLEIVNGPNVTSYGNDRHFAGCTNLKKVYLPKLTGMYMTFYGCSSLPSICLPSTTRVGSEGFSGCSSLKAMWLGSSITSDGLNNYSLYNCKALKKVFIDLPRATVEAFTYYSTAFSLSQHSTDIIICNDDEDFMTQEEFDTIDWATYTG